MVGYWSDEPGKNTNTTQPLALIFSYLTFRLSGICIQLGKGLKCTKTACKYIWQSGNPQFSNPHRGGNTDNKVLASLGTFYVTTGPLLPRES